MCVCFLLIGSGGFRKRKHDNFPHGQRREEKENVNPSSPLMTSFKCKKEFGKPDYEKCALRNLLGMMYLVME